jgi:hypothetical protein
VIMGVMHNLSLHPEIRGGDNVGGTMIGSRSLTFPPDIVSTLCHSF